LLKNKNLHFANSNKRNVKNCLNLHFLKASMNASTCRWKKITKNFFRTLLSANSVLHARKIALS
jgi:hypothetical protein